MTNTYQSARLVPQSHQPRQGIGSRAGSREAKGGRNRGERPEGGVLGYSRGQEALPTQGSLMRQQEPARDLRLSWPAHFTAS